MALAAVDTRIVATAVPQVVRDLGGFELCSRVFSGYLPAQTVAIPVYGKLVEQGCTTCSWRFPGDFLAMLLITGGLVLVLLFVTPRRSPVLTAGEPGHRTSAR